MVDYTGPGVQLVGGFVLVMSVGAVAVALIGGEAGSIGLVLRAIVPIVVAIVAVVGLTCYFDPRTAD